MTEALTLALYYWERREHMDEQAALAAAIELGNLGFYSSRQIGAIVGQPWWRVSKVTGKADRRGGRLNPADLPALRTLAALPRDGKTPMTELAEAAEAAIAGGTSTLVASRLTGVPEVSIKRYVERAKQMREEAA